MINFFRKYFFELMLVLIILGVLIFSLSTLTTKPRLWTDEALSIELARNFMSYGKLNLMTAPNVFSDVPFLLQSTGYPMTLPLALFFKLFGIGPWQARIYSLLLMIVFLLLVYWFAKKLFGANYAFLSLLLLATFASFYGNGRCVTGEVAGFVFLLLGLHFVLYKNRFFFGGFILGLAAVTKPSIYLLAVLATMVVFLMDWRNFWSKTFKFLGGLAPAIIFWIFFSVPNYFSADIWLRILNFYKNPFGQTSVIGSIVSNLINWPRSTTLIYFSVLFLIILGAIFWDKKFFKSNKNFLIFTVTYVILSFMYFLKSPGWLRYLAAAQFLIFIVLGPAMKAIINKLEINNANFFTRNKTRIFYGLMLFLVLIQLIHLGTGAQLFYSTASIDVISLLNKQAKDKTVGIINSPAISSLILSEKKYQILNTLLGLPSLGQDFLAFEQSRLPDLVVAGPDEVVLNNHKDTITKFYTLIYENGKYNVYAKK